MRRPGKNTKNKRTLRWYKGVDLKKTNGGQNPPHRYFPYKSLIGMFLIGILREISGGKKKATDIFPL